MFKLFLSTRTLVLLPFLIITTVVMVLTASALYAANGTLNTVSEQLQKAIDTENFLSELNAIRANIIYQSNEAIQTELAPTPSGQQPQSAQHDFYHKTLRLQINDYLKYLDELKLRPIANEPTVQILLHHAAASAHHDSVMIDAMMSGRPLAEIQGLRMIWSKSVSETESLMSDLVAANQQELSVEHHKITEVQQDVRNLQIYLLLVLAASFGVKYVLIQRFVLEPLAQFDSKVQSNLHTGHFETLGLSDQTEIGRLARAFDQLMLRIGVDEANLRSMATEQAMAAEVARNALQDLKKAKDRLVRSEKLSAVGTMVGGVAHEINNPLMGLMAYLEEIGRLSDEHQKTLVDKAQNQVTRIERIVRNMLMFARIPGQQQQVEPAALGPAITLVSELLEPVRKKASAQIIPDIADDVPRVLLPSDQLQQILLNLVKNALESLSERRDVAHPTVWISARRSDGQVHVRVSDNGPGVGAHAIDHLFEPFFTTKDPDKGTGLGLAVSLQLAEAVGGTILYSPRVGGGAQFTLALPGEHTS